MSSIWVRGWKGRLIRQRRNGVAINNSVLSLISMLIFSLVDTPAMYAHILSHNLQISTSHISRIGVW